MRPIHIVLGAMLLSLCGAACANDAKQSLDSFYAALASGDKAKALELLAPDVAIYESGYVERSRAEYASHHLGDDMAFSKGTTRKVLKQAERIEGSIAIIMEETETTGSFKGKPVHAFGTETVMLEKQGDAWLIKHVHWSSRKAK